MERDKSHLQNSGYHPVVFNWLPWYLPGKGPTANAGDDGSVPGSGRSPGGRNGTPVSSPGEPHGQRSLVGDSPRGHEESDTTQWLNNNIFSGWQLSPAEFWGFWWGTGGFRRGIGFSKNGSGQIQQQQEGLREEGGDFPKLFVCLFVCF